MTTGSMTTGSMTAASMTAAAFDTVDMTPSTVFKLKYNGNDLVIPSATFIGRRHVLALPLVKALLLAAGEKKTDHAAAAYLRVSRANRFILQDFVKLAKLHPEEETTHVMVRGDGIWTFLKTMLAQKKKVSNAMRIQLYDTVMEQIFCDVEDEMEGFRVKRKKQRLLHRMAAAATASPVSSASPAAAAAATASPAAAVSSASSAAAPAAVSSAATAAPVSSASPAAAPAAVSSAATAAAVSPAAAAAAVTSAAATSPAAAAVSPDATATAVEADDAASRGMVQWKRRVSPPPLMLTHAAASELLMHEAIFNARSQLNGQEQMARKAALKDLRHEEEVRALARASKLADLAEELRLRTALAAVMF
jgi:hypothetical protein